jgi:hypothetical protein
VPEAIFGKQDNAAINLSAIATGTGGFVINAPADSPLITMPSVLVPAAMADKLMASVLSCLPKMTYDLPANNLPLGSAPGKSYVIFGKQNNTDAINLSAVASGTGGFAINGESVNDYSGWSISSAGDVNGDGLDVYRLDRHYKHPQLNHLNRHH